MCLSLMPDAWWKPWDFGSKGVGQGRHHIYKHPNIVERLNLQPRQGQAKEYQLKQLKQLMELVEEYHLTLEEER